MDKRILNLINWAVEFDAKNGANIYDSTLEMYTLIEGALTHDNFSHQKLDNTWILFPNENKKAKIQIGEHNGYYHIQTKELWSEIEKLYDVKSI